MKNLLRWVLISSNTFSYGVLILVFNFLLFLNTTEAKPNILEMEHTFVEKEGSSWGTDDVLRKKVDLREENVPWLYRLPVRRPAPLSIKISSDSSSKHIFINDIVFLYRELNLCVDKKLKIEGFGFDQAMTVFLKKVSGFDLIDGRKPLKVNILKVDSKSMNPNSFKDCDVLAFQADDGQFPFSQFQEVLPSNSTDLPQLVLGLYYRQTETTLPVISFHPQLEIDFQGRSGKYLEASQGHKIKVDGRSLFFHELGHVLGFAHIKMPSSVTLNPELSVMGMDNSQRKLEQLELRLSAPVELWNRWDLQQTSLYRSLLWKWSKKLALPDAQFKIPSNWFTPYLCVMPGEVLDIQFRLFGIDEGSDSYATIKSLPSKITLNDPLVSTSPLYLFRSRELFSIFPGLELLIGYAGFVQEDFRFFKPEYLENFNYGVRSLAIDQMLPLRFQISTLVGRVSEKAYGKYILNGSFKAGNHFPGTYLPMITMDVFPEPSSCYY
ncbi:MAG: hypothetical protein J0M15_00195 [Deltaproteobacteria bacterium]|nr:hypothetical protein [Deltaproteobacteria bacterium]